MTVAARPELIALAPARRRPAQRLCAQLRSALGYCTAVSTSPNRCGAMIPAVTAAPITGMLTTISVPVVMVDGTANAVAAAIDALCP